jgi:ATP/maltotriose-dependent transcriptional regulator MalT/DNA-binding SARP family transcriptional activator
MKSSSLLRTKFLIPQLTSDRLPRPHLVEWLGNHIHKRLVLVSAPPGYGKTTLLADYLAASPLSAAWVQLDAADSDPSVFLTDLIEAIRQIQEVKKKNIGQVSLSLLESANLSVSPQQVLTVLINELTDELTHPWLLVLEDYHVIASPVVHQLVDFLLENGPASLHLLISTRMDPPLALARLRARGQLAELRTPDLRFREDEISTLIDRYITGVSSQSLTLLAEKTEGWAAALQIVCSSLDGQDASSADHFIASLNGSHRYIFEYLAGEVFQRQPIEYQTFLLHTSILSQMDADSCNALAGITQAQSMLEYLEEKNLFLTSLDTQRRWYRYHYLFREFLSSKLQREQPDQLVNMHKTAGEYYKHHGELEAAFSHFCEAAFWEEAALVLQGFAADYVERGRVEVLNRYLVSLPTEILQAKPELLLQHGNIRRRLGEAGLAINAFEDARLAFAERADRGGVSRALTHLAEVNRAQGNYRQAETLASEALSSAPPEDHSARADALMALAKSVGFLTGMDQGRRLAEQAMEEARLVERNISRLAQANFLQSLGQICWWHGDPHATVRYCKEALHLVPEEISPIAAQACISLVTPYLYWHELDTALDYAQQGLEITQTLHLRELLPSAYAALGNVLTRRGEAARAEACLRQSTEMAQTLGLAAYERLMAAGFLAYNLYGQGRVDEARQMAESALWAYTGSPDTYEAYVCRSVLADVALEQHRLSKAEGLYNELVEVGERRQFRIPLAMVYFGLAFIHLVTDRKESGLDFAHRSLKLIEPTQAFQLFLDQGERNRVVCTALQDAGEECLFLQHVMENLPAVSPPSLSVVDNTAVIVKCLGSFHVMVAGEEISQGRWVSAKARDLLAYFITFRGERLPAERVFDAIWADKAGRGMTAFHTALSRLRNALRTDEPTPRFILVETGEYWLDTAAFSVDVDEFDSELAKARAASGQEASARLYEKALSLYRGEYLGNFYYEWAFPERRRLTQAYLSALSALADFHFMRERYTNALELLQRALRVDNLLEELHCKTMRVYAALGDRAGLVRQYQELKDILDSDLGIGPSVSTLKLYQRLIENVER